MSGIAGILDLPNDASDYTVNNIGQRNIYDATNVYLRVHSEEMMLAAEVFIDPVPTENYQENYKLPGGGRLQKRARQAEPAAVKPYGGWTVAYPIEDFGASVAGDDVTYAYMSLAEMQRAIDTVRIQDINALRAEILYRLFNNTVYTYEDELRGALSIQPLANGDSVVYPPVTGTETEATDDHYLESGYAATAISTTNNPYETIAYELTEHFGDMTGGNNIVCFINRAEKAETLLISGFEDVPDNFIQVGTNTNVPVRLPRVPGKILGRETTSGVWVVEWDWIPANYIVGIHLDAPQPLKMRVDPANTGLPRGLQLVATSSDFPLQKATWRHRYGLGTANRLNGVVMELGTGGTYTIPAAYQ